MQEPLVYSVTETARLLGIGRNAAYAGVAKGEIPSIRVGDRILVPVAALERWLFGPNGMPKPDA